MEDITKAEKRAAGRLLLQQYQKKTKDGKSSPSLKSDLNHRNDTSVDSKVNQRISEEDHVKNGHSEYKTGNIGLFTFQKEDSPAEQFFDSFKPSPQQSSPDHSDRCDNSLHEAPSVLPYECSISSRSSRSDDEASRRLIESPLINDPLKEEMERKLAETNENVVYFENEVKNMRTEMDKLRSQHIPLEEKVQLHLKTIEILVSEKSELQLQLFKITEEFMNERSKFEDVSAKLKFSQEQLGNLRSELSETYEAREQHNTILKKLEHNLVEANSTMELCRKEVNDSKEEINLLKQKLEQMTCNTQELKKQIDEKDKQLSMAEMKMAQMGAGNIPSKADINKVGDLEKECSLLKEEIKKIEKEKLDTVNQYQQYIDTLNSQILLLNQQYESCLVSKNQLLTREESLVKHISELEKEVQKQHQAGPSLTETNTKLNQELKESTNQISELKSLIEKKDEEIAGLNVKLNETSTKLYEAELSLERLEIPDARKLQAAIENDRVAATRAVQQNTQLKNHVTELQEAIVRLNNEKLDLTVKWEHSEYLMSEINRELKKYKEKGNIEYRDAVAQCTVVFHTDHASQADIEDLDIPTSSEHVNPESVALLEKKLKKTMNDFANLHEEKQRLEHLVLHLQSETETIGEYVTLYQNQRCLLQERAKERDRQMASVSKEREELKLKLAQISSLLPQVIQEPGPTISQSSVHNGDSQVEPAIKIKTLLSEIETSNLMTDVVHEVPNNFHPCLLCSGKLITI